ncbi:MAG: CGNR zinc finger domain-containing protein [Steroidobacter sp.]
MPPLFIGSHLAVDFLNTALAPRGQEIETIGDGRAYLRWIVGAGLLTEAEASRLLRRFGVRSLDLAAAEARQVREWARVWLSRWRAAPEDDYGDEIAVLNKLLARETRHDEVVTAEEGLSVIERAHIESADALLALIAGQIAALITQEQPSLLRRCAGPACTLWFLDRTKAHRRLFCSAATCGNRAKVAAFRERQRG